MGLKLHFFLLVFICSLYLGSGIEAGTIYEWIDKDGTRHFTDGPPPPGAQLVEGLSDTQSDGSPPRSGPTDDGNTAVPEGDEPGPNEAQDKDAVEGGEKDPTGREAYWRRRGWRDGPPNPEDTGPTEDGERVPPDSENAAAVENAENAPAPPEDAAPAEDGEKDPGGNDDQWRSRGW